MNLPQPSCRIVSGAVRRENGGKLQSAVLQLAEHFERKGRQIPSGRKINSVHHSSLALICYELSPSSRVLLKESVAPGSSFKFHSNEANCGMTN